MRKTATKATEVTTLLCDYCGETCAETCDSCGRDVCGVHGAWLHYDPFYGVKNYDYPPTCCNDCHELLEEPTKHAGRINNAHEKQIELLRNHWLKKCKEKASEK